MSGPVVEWSNNITKGDEQRCLDLAEKSLTTESVRESPLIQKSLPLPYLNGYIHAHIYILYMYTQTVYTVCVHVVHTREKTTNSCVHCVCTCIYTCTIDEWAFKGTATDYISHVPQ